MTNDMRTLDDLDNLSDGDNTKTYNLLVYSPYTNESDKILSSLNKNTPFKHDDYTWAIPEGEYLYFTNAHTPSQTLKVSKNNYKKLLRLPMPEFYPVDEREKQEDSTTGMCFHKEYIRIGKTVEMINLRVSSNELLRLKEKDRIKKILSKINECENISKN